MAGFCDIDARRGVAEDAERPEGLLRVFAMGKVGRAEVGGGTDGSGILIVAMSKGGPNSQGQVTAKSAKELVL